MTKPKTERWWCVRGAAGYLHPCFARLTHCECKSAFRNAIGRNPMKTFHETIVRIEVCEVKK